MGETPIGRRAELRAPASLDQTFFHEIYADSTNNLRKEGRAAVNSGASNVPLEQCCSRQHQIARQLATSKVERSGHSVEPRGQSSDQLRVSCQESGSQRSEYLFNDDHPRTADLEPISG